MLHECCAPKIATGPTAIESKQTKISILAIDTYSYRGEHKQHVSCQPQRPAAMQTSLAYALVTKPSYMKVILPAQRET